ncbi:IS30 family transposase, partial [Streptomyces marinisediminis]|uniref:IS30 family transposase n=2 Tax=Streptomyces TaxID=1883 RepID=UPI0022488195
DRRASGRRRRPQVRLLERDVLLRERVLAGLRYGRTPNQIAGRLKLEAADDTVGLMEGSLPAGKGTVSHEAVCTWIYALPKGELARLGVMLPSGRTRRGPRRRPAAGNGARIVGMRSIHDRPAEALGRQVPGHWEGDLIIGRDGSTAAATLVDRATRFLMLLALPRGRNADGLATALTQRVRGVPELVRKSLTWDQGTEMGRHAALTLATGLDVYFADPHSPWQRPTNENTNGIIRRYLPKGTEITDHQPYLTAIAEEINNQPRRCLGYLTPQEAFQRALTEGVASTN